MRTISPLPDPPLPVLDGARYASRLLGWAMTAAEARAIGEAAGAAMGRALIGLVCSRVFTLSDRPADNDNVSPAELVRARQARRGWILLFDV